jgi:hypothetical protein
MDTPDSSKKNSYSLAIFIHCSPMISGSLKNCMQGAEHAAGEYAYIGVTVTKYSALLRLAYKFVSEKLLIPANLL